MNSATYRMAQSGPPVHRGMPKRAQEACDAWLLGVADHLHGEFSAPIGILDPEGQVWKVVVGVPETSLPRVGTRLREAVGTTRLASGKAAILRQPESPSIQWLILPLRTVEAVDLAVFAGFRSPPDVRDALLAGTDETVCEDDETVRWGPECPDPALRAWGLQVLGQLPIDRGGRRPGSEPPRSPQEESDHVVIGRLIRRMRISEPPRHFQSLATNVLKASLGIAAVAWIPSDSREDVVVSGAIEGMRSASYRDLIPAGPKETPGGGGESRVVSTRPGIEPVQAYASVAAGSAGWLVAVNPGKDRTLGTPEVERMQYVASLIATQASNARIYAELKELLFGIIRALTAAIDAKDPYTSGHSERVARIAVRLAQQLGIPAAKRSDLYLAGLLHDIGKIGIDDVVLKKTGPLTPEEYRKIQAHVEIGVTILKDLKKLSHIIPGVRHHHESMDGSGYPDHLSGDEIPLEARVLAVADSFDAMSSNRPYRKRLSPMQIDEILRKGRGTQWDSEVIDALFACRMDVEAIRQKGLGESLIGAVNLTLGRG